MIKAGIIGGAGYTGGELIRLLINHPLVEIVFVQSGSNAGNLLSKVHQDLIGETEITFVADCPPLTTEYIDVLFFCAGHGEAKKFVLGNEIAADVKLIDIGNDFRLKEDANLKGRQFIYGLPELNRELIKKADSIANPGCFATAIQLGLLPFAKEGAFYQQEIYTTGITGSTGAGQSLSPTSHFSWRSNNIQAYKTLTHQHNAEIKQSLIQAEDSIRSNDISLNFVPWRGDFARGIFVSSTFKCTWGKEQILKVFKEAYKNEPFTKISLEPIHLKQVVNTNKCVVNIEIIEDKVVVHSVIDNLLKGASGQALQNMNLMFGFEETLGLKLKAAAF
ncbi:N-acetyl-gamma-glutamyl-phosphate reductase [Parasediminibacterium sp. JCM 36343]|uniref:N-acetyl-gamma-glutamyl-phosphate reductase n=1 Tax=Parasediminibacterium sp. JCM 36343 TaxID=3374279 RepID=UPI00397E4F04